MKRRRDLSSVELFDSYYAPVQTYDVIESSDHFKMQRIKDEQKQLQQELHANNGIKGWIVKASGWLYKIFFAHFGEEWLFLAFLGILMGHISFMIDKGVFMCAGAQKWLYTELASRPGAKYFAWICLPVCLCMWSAGFVKLVGPKAVGSGIAEIKTVLRGVYLKDFLTFRVLVAKVVGITAIIGSNMPVGKEGPLMHISCCCAHLLGKLSTFQGIYQNESRKLEILAAAAALGVGVTFASPIGGVLLSIELTTAYYGVRNYWRSFCAAVWGATVYRYLYVWVDGFESFQVVFKTSFFVDTPWAAQELFAFSILGILCGIGAAFYMRMKKSFGRLVKNHKVVQTIKSSCVFIYPGFISLVVSSITFPLGIGQYLSGHIGYGPQVQQLFGNFSWGSPNLTVAQQDVVKLWETKYTGFYLHLVCLAAYNFVCSILATSMPIPCGSFIPNFRIGAAMGRIMGELMVLWHPTGLSYFGRVTHIMPGGYAIVGAAAFSGAVTQTMCVGIIILEMTSQITHVIPILVANLIANSIAQLCGSGLYDSAIKAKNLPFIPDKLPKNDAIYSVYVEDFMITDVKHIYHGMSFEELKNVLVGNKKISSYPLVNNRKEKILLGSISRVQLIELIENQVGKDRKMKEITEKEQRYVSIAAAESSQENSFTDNPLYESPSIVRRKSTDKSITLPQKRICDLPLHVQKYWEQTQMSMPVDFRYCQIDPAPFQLVEKTSLLKVHSLFSLVGINTAYVTSIGKLIGVVGLSELRKAISDVKNGNLQPHNISIVISEEK